jgi:hypothetical protein
MRLSDLSPEGLRAEITRRQLTSDEAVRVVRLREQFHRAVGFEQYLRRIVRQEVDEAIQARIGVV